MKTIDDLKNHVQVLSVNIGSRSIKEPDKLEAAALYVESELESAGLYVLMQEFEAEGALTAKLVARTPAWTGDPLSQFWVLTTTRCVGRPT